MKKVLFVCIENSNRSQMAEAFARIHGSGLVEPYSAGSNPSGRVNPKAIHAMSLLNYDISQHRSKSVDELPQQPYDYVVGMGCGDACPVVPSKEHLEWDIPDPRNFEGDDFLKIRDAVEERVIDLVNKLDNTHGLCKLMLRDLDRLYKDVESYSNEGDLWRVSGDIKNSAGNLALHICGNLQHFIGAVLGNSGYTRQRDAEFSDKHIPIKEILENIEQTKSVVEKTLYGLDQETLDSKYPIDLWIKGMTTRAFLSHLYGHLNYHLGQVNYHQRLLD